MPTSKAQSYRIKAEELRGVASEIASQTARQVLMKAAAQYDELATKLMEGGSNSSEDDLFLIG